MGTYQAIDNANTPQSRATALSPGGGAYTGGTSTGAGGTGTPELTSRNASFGAGAISHAVPTVGLQAAQQRYSAVLAPQHVAAAAGVLGQAPGAGSPAVSSSMPSQPGTT